MLASPVRKAILRERCLWIKLVNTNSLAYSNVHIFVWSELTMVDADDESIL